MAPIDDREHEKPPSLYQLDKQVAVLSERITSLTTTFGTRFDSTDRNLDDVISRYATKDELDDVRKAIEAVQAQIGWAVKIVLRLVLVGLVSLVISKNGLPHG